MPCYPCGHCNACGLFSLKLEVTCATCGADVIAGETHCPVCGSAYRNNTVRGKMGKPKDAVDYYTRIEEAKGEDGHRLTEMSVRWPMSAPLP